MKKKTTAKDYFKIWVLSIVIFGLTLLALINFAETSPTIENTIMIFLLLTVLTGVVAFILMFIKAFSSILNKKKEKRRIALEEIEKVNKIPEPNYSIEDKQKFNSKIADLLDDEINDVIFQPKKKSAGSTFFWLIIVLIIFFSLFLFNNSGPDQAIQEKQADSQITNFAGYLQLENPEINWKNHVQYFSGTLKNISNTHHIVDVLIRLDFSKDEAGKNKFDTRYVKIEAVPKSGAFTFNEPIYINSPVQSWWWTCHIESADGWE